MAITDDHINNISGTVKGLQKMLIAALIIPTLLFVGAIMWDLSTILHQEEVDALKLISVFQGQADNLFKGHSIILDLIVSRIRDQDWDKVEQTAPDLLHDLETVDLMLDDASAILVLDEKGKTRATTLHGDESNLGSKSCFLSFQRGDPKTCISDPYVEPSSGHLFSLARRLEKNGIFTGMAQVGISADFIMNLWAAALPRSTDTIAIVRSDGVALAQPTAHLGSPVPSLPQNATNDGVIDDGQQITIIRKITNYPAYIVMSLDRSMMLMTWYRAIVIYAAIAVVATMGIMLAIGTVIRQAKTERRALEQWQAQSEKHERERTNDQLMYNQKVELLRNQQQMEIGRQKMENQLVQKTKFNTDDRGGYVVFLAVCTASIVTLMGRMWDRR